MNIPHILAVDDEPSSLTFIKANLEARGYQVLVTADGEKALRIAEKEKPQLILLHIIIPGIDGFAVCCKIREWSSAPIIMLSAREGENDKERCVVCGANDYLTKPFVLKELLSTVSTLLKQK